ncbi:MAG TPA: TetR/AcrR family transcriptional regulator [Solirubrobacteraceae bacterium]|jgi:AcrR family transcriptional regulator|nr:TetR/AcrR family transcriptional regulator [Solirubrobacteraceae bacterium]
MSDTLLERGPRADPYQKLCPHPNGLSPQQVARHQRRRLLRALVELVAQRGYDAATVGRLCATAGVSKRAFYELFTGKPDCFEHAYRRLLDRIARRAADARGERPPGRDALCATLQSLMDDAARAPEGASFLLVHALDSASAAIARRESAFAVIEDAVAACLPRADRPPSPALLRGIVAGICAVARERLLAGEADSLPQTADSLTQWAWRCAHAAEWGCDERRDGAELIQLHVHRQESIARGPRSAIRNRRDERVSARAIELAARHGVLALTPGALADWPGAPGRRRRPLRDPDRVLLDAVEWAAGRLAADLAAIDRPSPAGAERARPLMQLLLRRLARDAALSRVAFVEALAVGPQAVAWQAGVCARAAEELGRVCAPRGGPADPIQMQASVGAVWGLVERHVWLGATARLPRLLAPAQLFLSVALGGAAAKSDAGPTRLPIEPPEVEVARAEAC